jgi:4-diphosphocytidyl-2-C-methyl-D-erythritol kinase
LAEGGLLVERACAKVNLTLRVFGRRPDGYHELESLVAFADVADRLELLPGDELALTVRGATASDAGPPQDNLVLKAARLLTQNVPELRIGRLVLTKQLPVAAGLGGGSADAAAALRLLAWLNDLPPDDPRLLAAAAATGADVPVCLSSRMRIMRGMGDILSEPLNAAPLPAVLVNPRVTLPTREVFAALNRPLARDFVRQAPTLTAKADLVAFLQQGANDLEAPAISLRGVVADVLAELRALAGAQLARMSGSGSTCFAIFESASEAQRAARSLRERRPGWWVRATKLGDGNCERAR